MWDSTVNGVSFNYSYVKHVYANLAFALLLVYVRDIVLIKCMFTEIHALSTNYMIKVSKATPYYTTKSDVTLSVWTSVGVIDIDVTLSVWTSVGVIDIDVTLSVWTSVGVIVEHIRPFSTPCNE